MSDRPQKPKDNANVDVSVSLDLDLTSIIVDEDDMVSDSALKVPSQQSVKAYVDNNSGHPLLDEDDMASDSATSVASQQSIKAYVDNNAGGDWVKISETVASSTSSVDFTGLSSTYRAYKVILSNVTPATDDSFLTLLTSTDNGSSYDSASGNYSWSAYRLLPSSGGSSQGADSATYIPICDPTSTVRLGTASQENMSSEVTIFNPSDTHNCKVTFQSVYKNTVGFFTGFQGCGYRNSAADVDAIRFIFNSGNIASGTFTLYGLKA